MSRIEPCILMNMVMIYDQEGNVLVQNRLDPNWPGICFPGGHVEPTESFVHSAIREIKEETGLDITNLELCGICQWQDPDARCLVLLYKTCHFSGELQSSEEGEVFWIRQEDLLSQKLAPNFQSVIALMEAEEFSEDYGVNTEVGTKRFLY